MFPQNPLFVFYLADTWQEESKTANFGDFAEASGMNKCLDKSDVWLVWVYLQTSADIPSHEGNVIVIPLFPFF